MHLVILYPSTPNYTYYVHCTLYNVQAPFILFTSTFYTNMHLFYCLQAPIIMCTCTCYILSLVSLHLYISCYIVGTGMSVATWYQYIHSYIFILYRVQCTCVVYIQYTYIVASWYDRTFLV